MMAIDRSRWLTQKIRKFWLNMRSPGLRAKAVFLSGIFIAGTVFAGVFGSYTLYSQSISLKTMLSSSQTRADHAADSRAFLIDMMRAQAQLIAEVDPERIRDASRNAIRALSLMDENIQTLNGILIGNDKVATLGKLLQQARPALLKVIGKARQNDDVGALEQNRFMIKTLSEIESLANEIVADERKNLLEAMNAQVKSGLDRIKILAIGIGVFAAAGMVLSLFAARAIANPIRLAADAAEKVAAGDLTAQVSSRRSDELGRLLTSIATMVQNLAALIRQVKGSGDQLASTASQITAAAEQQEQISNSFGMAGSQIASSVSQISATSAELLGTMTDVAAAVDATAAVADRGRDDLRQMEETMQLLAAATESVSAKLALIAERTSNIGSVVTTITKVADQTNLLSLNAAIEAEKAGEYGLGFAVVSREIRRLADQTAVATLDIERIVDEMRSSVAGGVMEMERFDHQVQQGVSKATRLSGQLGAIIEGVEVLKPRFESVYEGMQAQVAGATQISAAVAQLRDVNLMSRTSSDTLQSASIQLRDAVDSLETGIQRFHF